MYRFLAVLFLIGTAWCAETVPGSDSERVVDRQELREAAERFVAEHPNFVPDLRSTAPPIAEQLRSREAKKPYVYYCASCQRDSKDRIRRSTAARSAFRRQNPCPATGHTTGACPGYVIDHIEALKRGGADSPQNMQWQTLEEARAKDRWE